MHFKQESSVGDERSIDMKLPLPGSAWVRNFDAAPPEPGVHTFFVPSVAEIIPLVRSTRIHSMRCFQIL